MKVSENKKKFHFSLTLKIQWSKNNQKNYYVKRTDSQDSLSQNIYEDLIKNQKMSGRFQTKLEDPLFILYTSGLLKAKNYALAAVIYFMHH